MDAKKGKEMAYLFTFDNDNDLLDGALAAHSGQLCEAYYLNEDDTGYGIEGAYLVQFDDGFKDTVHALDLSEVPGPSFLSKTASVTWLVIKTLAKIIGCVLGAIVIIAAACCGGAGGGSQAPTQSSGGFNPTPPPTPQRRQPRYIVEFADNTNGNHMTNAGPTFDSAAEARHYQWAKFTSQGQIARTREI